MLMEVVESMRDISEAMHSSPRTAPASEVSQLKSAFLANVSHEIRTPLNVILGYAELINEHLAGKGDESQREAVAAIMRAGNRLSDTIQDILDISRFEAGAFEVEVTQVDLNAAVTRQLDDFRAVARRKGIELQSQIEESAVILVFDEYCLTRALRALIDNAIKFTERGAIAIRLYRDISGAPSLEIRDSGIGIARDHLASLFDPFSQQRTGLDRPFEGLGLGLALCRRYLDLNGAAISVDTREGVGTVFTIRFAPDCESKFANQIGAGLSSEIRRRSFPRR